MASCRSDNGTRGKKGEDLFFENRNGSEMKALKTREHDVHPDGFSISCRTHRCGMENMKVSVLGGVHVQSRSCEGATCARMG